MYSNRSFVSQTTFYITTPYLDLGLSDLLATVETSGLRPQRLGLRLTREAFCGMHVPTTAIDSFRQIVHPNTIAVGYAEAKWLTPYSYHRKSMVSYSPFPHIND